MHRLTYADLRHAGVPEGAATASFAMTYEGSAVSIEVVDGDGAFTGDDLVIFYAEPYRGRYMKSNVYFFWYGGSRSDDRIATRASTPAAGQPIRDWTYRTAVVEFDEQYVSAYPLPSTADHFFDSPTLQATASVPGTTVTYAVPLENPLPLGDVRVRARLFGGKEQEPNPDQSAQMLLNGHELGVHIWDGQTGYVASATAPAAYLDASLNEVSLKTDLAQLPALSEYWVYADRVEVDYPSALVANSDRVDVPDLDLAGGLSVEVVARGFTSGAVRAYDIRDPRRPVRITGAGAAGHDGSYEVRFRDAWSAADPAPEYALATEAALLAPQQVEVADAPPWNTPDNQADYIAIVHPSLWNEIQPLLDKRTADGLRVAKVDPQHIYDLFSSGRLDPEAIRLFLAYAYFNWNAGGSPPRYVLLVGDGNYDFKGVTNTPQLNLIPPYLVNVDPWIGETAADNRYVSVDGPDDFMPDMAIGRIPAQTPTDVTNAVNKILGYEDPATTPSGAWQNTVSFVADQADDAAGNFQAISEDARLNWLPPSYNSRHIYWETDHTVAYPNMNDAIKNAFANSLLVQWFGHASRFIWGSTQVFSTFSVPSIPPGSQWPVSIDYSCWTGYFVNLHGFYGDYRSLAEALLLTPGKGSVVAIAPSGQHGGSALQVLNRGFMKAIFQEQHVAIGDAFNAAKAYYLANSTAWPDVVDTTVLFGDPATKLRLIRKAAPPALSIRYSATPAAIDLVWSDLENLDSYQVWRSEDPAFEPPAGGTQVGVVDGALFEAGAEIVFTDDGAAGPPAVIAGDAARNYFWLARGMNVRGASPDSNRIGEFDFVLAPGAP